MKNLLQRLLFVGTLALAAALALLVPAAPQMHAALSDDSPVVRLFAEDAVVRRTALASALGLAVTAFVFFRPVRLPRPNRRPPRPGPPGGIAGA